MLRDKKIILGITGSIAAYKSPLLVRLLVKGGADVQVVMTPAAKDFVTPLTLSTLSKRPVIIEPFEPATGEWNNHVELGNWADIMLIAPVTANTLAKMAAGIADNFLLTVYLSVKSPVYFAPAMDLDMFQHPSTQSNIARIHSFGNIIIPPNEGELASGLCGAGRMEEPERIYEILSSFFEKKNILKGIKALVTAGPTYEAIDPVRFIGNHSSGLMGYSIAQELASKGADVVLISGPASVNMKHPNVRIIEVVSADEMYKKCLNQFPDSHITVMAAAVADFTPADPQKSKIKKSENLKNIQLKPTKDILSEMGKIKKENQVLVGFALETDRETENAIEKLHNKNLDFIVLNSLRDAGAGFGHNTNKIKIIDINERIFDYELKSKPQVAKDIVSLIIEKYFKPKV